MTLSILDLFAGQMKYFTVRMVIFPLVLILDLTMAQALDTLPFCEYCDNTDPYKMCKLQAATCVPHRICERRYIIHVCLHFHLLRNRIANDVLSPFARPFWT